LDSLSSRLDAAVDLVRDDVLAIDAATALVS
ncbi:unnamed protein product, partial [Urochloa humidicola]